MNGYVGLPGDLTKLLERDVDDILAFPRNLTPSDRARLLDNALGLLDGLQDESRASQLLALVQGVLASLGEHELDSYRARVLSSGLIGVIKRLPNPSVERASALALGLIPSRAAVLDPDTWDALKTAFLRLQRSARSEETRDYAHAVLQSPRWRRTGDASVRIPASGRAKRLRDYLSVLAPDRLPGAIVFAGAVVLAILSFAMLVVRIPQDGYDESADATPAALAALNLNDVAGTWTIETVPMASDSVLVPSRLVANNTTDGWTLHIPGRDSIPVRVMALDGDSVVMVMGPFPSVLREGQMVTTRNVVRFQNGMLVGTITATYSRAGLDSAVATFRLRGTRVQ